MQSKIPYSGKGVKGAAKGEPLGPLPEKTKKEPGLTRRGNSNDMASDPIIPIPASRRAAGTMGRAEHR